MRGGLKLVVKVVHVVEPVGGMQGRMVREGVTSAEEITAGSPVAGSPATSATSAAASAAARTATAAGGCASDCRCAAGQSETFTNNLLTFPSSSDTHLLTCFLISKDMGTRICRIWVQFVA